MRPPPRDSLQNQMLCHEEHVTYPAPLFLAPLPHSTLLYLYQSSVIRDNPPCPTCKGYIPANPAMLCTLASDNSASTFALARSSAVISGFASSASTSACICSSSSVNLCLSEALNTTSPLLEPSPLSSGAEERRSSPAEVCD